MIRAARFALAWLTLVVAAPLPTTLALVAVCGAPAWTSGFVTYAALDGLAVLLLAAVGGVRQIVYVFAHSERTTPMRDPYPVTRRNKLLRLGYYWPVRQ